MKAEQRPTLFISDLHLAPGRPDISRSALAFLAGPAAQAAALYILGDLFEAWIGDDDLDDPLHAEIVAALRRLSAAGVRLGIQHGNRDFLLGEAFAAASGAQLLPDPWRLDLYGVPTLLLHGDSLCTDDQAYQQYRAQTRQPAWQAAVLAKPLEVRRAMARQLRTESEAAKDGKSQAIMDANLQAVTDAFLDHGVARLIHGHTHRPARHLHQVAGKELERWVLPDWEQDGGYLSCDASGCRLLNLSN